MTQRLVRAGPGPVAAPVQRATDPAAAAGPRRRVAHDMAAACGFLGGPADSIDASLALVQRAGDAHTGLDDDAIAAHAARGIGSGDGGRLPHLDAIQRAFGPDHDVTGVRAHVGGAAAEASTAIGAHAYATGDAVAFSSAPDLFLAAHEAAHVVQQRQGVSLEGAVGQVGDRYEQQADAVAAAVVRGDSAAGLLGDGAGAGGAVQPTLQRKAGAKAKREAAKQAALERKLAAQSARLRAAFEEHWQDPAPPTISSYLGAWIRPRATCESLALAAVCADEETVSDGGVVAVDWSTGAKFHVGMKGRVIGGYPSLFGDLVQVAMAGDDAVAWFLISDVIPDAPPGARDTAKTMDAKEAKLVETMCGDEGAFSPEMIRGGADLLKLWLPKPGDAVQLTLRVNFPLVALPGGNGFFELVMSAERDDQVKVRGELNAGVYGKIDLGIFEAFAQVKAGLFMEASGDDGAECLRLLGLGAHTAIAGIAGAEAAGYFFAPGVVGDTRKHMDANDYVDVGGQVEATGGLVSPDDWKGVPKFDAKAGYKYARGQHITGDAAVTQSEHKLSVEGTYGGWGGSIQLSQKGAEPWKLTFGGKSEVDMVSVMDGAQRKQIIVAVLGGVASAVRTAVTQIPCTEDDVEQLRGLASVVGSGLSMEFGLGALASGSKLGVAAKATIAIEIESTMAWPPAIKVSLFRSSTYEYGNERPAVLGAYAAYEDKERLGEWLITGSP